MRREVGRGQTGSAELNGRTLELEPRLIDPTLIPQYFPDFKLKVEEVKAKKSTRAWPAWPWPGLPWQPGLAFAAAR